jgi:hypothetical protein
VAVKYVGTGGNPVKVVELWDMLNLN